MNSPLLPAVLAVSFCAATGCSGSGTASRAGSSSAGASALGGGAGGARTSGGGATGADTAGAGPVTVAGSANGGGGMGAAGASGSLGSAGRAARGGAAGRASTGGSSGAGIGGSGGASAGGSGGVNTTGSGGSGTSDAGSSSEGNPGGPASSATSTIVGNGCTPPAQYENLFITALGQTQDSSNAKLEAAWNQLYNPSNANTVFYNGPGTGEAYVKDIADNDVRTEGQSYGMMTALQLDHQTEFDELWTFAKNHMVKASGGAISSIAWSVSTSGGSSGAGGAPDGDEWFAAALVFAHYRWGDSSGKYDYGSEAQAVLDMVRKSDFDAPTHLVRYYAGTSSNGTDGSYVLPAYYQTWACFDTTNADFWNAAVTAGRSFFHSAADSNGVIGDQSSFTGMTTDSTGDDKLRCVANIMSDHNFFDADPWQTQTYAPEYGAHEAKGTSSTAELACDGLLGFGLPASSGTTFVKNLWSAAIPTGQWRYYDGTLYTLALLHVSGAFRLWY
ncbi:MAG TPA: glycosyl hydrolase family 8 [Polyangiaceae bacterium]|nr:glycosyl hydrolase family 8 [Polyangiaceae bacterium]